MLLSRRGHWTNFLLDALMMIVEEFGLICLSSVVAEHVGKRLLKCEILTTKCNNSFSDQLTIFRICLFAYFTTMNFVNTIRCFFF